MTARPLCTALMAALLLLAVGPALGATPSTNAPPGAPVLTAAAINTTSVTATWSTPSGVVTNYTLEYARFYGLPIAFVNVVGKNIYNITDLGSGLTYYLTVWAWNGSVEGPPSNVAAVQTDLLPPFVPPFPWQELDAITLLSITGSLAFSAAVAVYVSGRRGRRAEGAAVIALARTAPRRPYSGLPPSRTGGGRRP